MITTSATCKHNLSSHLLLVIHDHYVRHLQTQPIITLGFCWSYMITTSATCKHNLSSHLLLVIHDHYVRHLQTQPIITPSVGHTWSLRPPPANTTYHHTFCWSYMITTSATCKHNLSSHLGFCWSYMITTSATCKHNLSSHLLLVIHDHYVRHLQTQPIITPGLLLVIHDHYVRHLQTQPIITPKLLLVIHDHYVRHLQTQPIITPSVGHTWSLRPPPANTTYHHTWASVGHTWSLHPPPANTTYHHTFCWSYMITTSATCKHNLSSHLGFCWSYMITTSATCKHNLSSHLLLVIHDHYVRHLQTQPIITPGLLLVIHDHYVRHLQTQPIITPSVGHTWSLRPPPANTTYHHTFCWSYMITTSATCKHNLSSHLLLVIHDHYVRHLQTQPIITPSVGHTWSLRPPPANTTYHHTFCWSYMITTSATCKHNLSSHLLLVIHDHYVRHLQTQPIITPSVGHTWSLRPPPANTTYHHTFCWSYMITTSATCKHNLSSHLLLVIHDHYVRHLQTQPIITPGLLLVIHDHYIRHLQTQPIITPSVGHTWSLRPPPANTTYHHT